MKDEPSKPEIKARLMLAGDQEALDDFKGAISRDDVKEVLPIMFALRVLTKINEPDPSFGRWCAHLLINDCKEPTIAGGLLTLVALHAPENLTGLRRKLIATGLFDWAALETIIHLRNQLVLKSKD